MKELDNAKATDEATAPVLTQEGIYEMNDQRTINNNPTGRPFCCVVGCNDDATLDIQNPHSPGISPADCGTQSCGAHVLELSDPGCYVSPVERPFTPFHALQRFVDDNPNVNCTIGGQCGEWSCSLIAPGGEIVEFNGGSCDAGIPLSLGRGSRLIEAIAQCLASAPADNAPLAEPTQPAQNPQEPGESE